MAARTVPVSATRATNDKITASAWNAGPVASNTFLTGRPVFQNYPVATTTSSGVITALPLNTFQYFVDSDTGFNSSFATRYTCQVAGWYVATGGVGWNLQPGRTQRMTLIRKNGADIPTAATEYDNFASAIWDVGAPVFLVQLAVGDYLEVYSFQNSGTSTIVQSGPYETGVLFLQWVSS